MIPVKFPKHINNALSPGIHELSECRRAGAVTTFAVRATLRGSFELGAGIFQTSLAEEDDTQLITEVRRIPALGNKAAAFSVTICLVTDPNRLIVERAEMLASRIFATIRVRLLWYEPSVCPSESADPILVMLETRTAKDHSPAALGETLQLHDAWVFYDRVLRASPSDKYFAALLGHVMAHEIAHVLQGINRHSASGILKAHWTDIECERMANSPLLFTREDAILIHHGLQERRARLVSSESVGGPATRSGEKWDPREMSLTVP